MEHAVAEKLFILLHRPSAQDLDPGTDPGQRIFDLVGQRRRHPARILHFCVVIKVFQKILKGSRKLADLVLSRCLRKAVLPEPVLVLIELFTRCAHAADRFCETPGEEHADLDDDQETGHSAHNDVILFFQDRVLE